MKYLLLIYSEPNAWSPNEHAVALAESVALCHVLNEQRQYIAASPLQPIETATTVRVRSGKLEVVDGPYAETKEHLAGYFLVDVETLEQAIEIASRIPGSRRGATEIRPIVELDNLPLRTPNTATQTPEYNHDVTP